MGKPFMGLSFEQMVVVWTIAAKHITKLYNRKIREGIG